MSKVEQPSDKPKEEKTVEEDTHPKFKSSAGFKDPESEDSADRIKDSMHEVEEVDGSGDMVRVEDGDTDLEFLSDGENGNAMTIMPYDKNEKYTVIILGVDGEIVREMPDITGDFNARINFVKGNYKIVLKPRRAKNMPFVAKVY